ncbi:MAG: hypothetical protein ACXABO_10140 [Promethearchaeota archaeon]|jgi:hypothetical protein
MISEDFDHRIEMCSSNKAKLEVVELVLKTLKIRYDILPSIPHTSKINKLIFEESLAQVQDNLVSFDYGNKLYAEQIKMDFEARRYWRKQFQKFHKLEKNPK